MARGALMEEYTRIRRHRQAFYVAAHGAGEIGQEVHVRILIPVHVEWHPSREVRPNVNSAESSWLRGYSIVRFATESGKMGRGNGGGAPPGGSPPSRSAGLRTPSPPFRSTWV